MLVLPDRLFTWSVFMHVRPVECQKFIDHQKDLNKNRLGQNNKRLQPVPLEIVRKSKLYDANNYGTGRFKKIILNHEKNECIKRKRVLNIKEETKQEVLKTQIVDNPEGEVWFPNDENNEK